MGVFIEAIAPFLHGGRPIGAGEVIEIEPTKAFDRLRALEAAPACLLTTPSVWLPSEGAAIYEVLRAITASYLDLNRTPIELGPHPNTSWLRAAHYRGQKPWTPRNLPSRHPGTLKWVHGWGDSNRPAVGPQPLADIDALTRRYLIDRAVADFFTRLENGSLLAYGVSEDDLMDRKIHPIASSWWAQDISLDLKTSALHEHIGPGRDAPVRRYSEVQIKNYPDRPLKGGLPLQDAVNKAINLEQEAAVISGPPASMLPESLIGALRQGRIVASGRPEGTGDERRYAPPALWAGPRVTAEIESRRLLYRRLDCTESATFLGDVNIALNGVNSLQEALLGKRSEVTSAAEYRCRQKLFEVARGGNLPARNELFLTMKAEDPDLSRYAFDRTWEHVRGIHPEIAAPGRKRKSKS